MKQLISLLLLMQTLTVFSQDTVYVDLSTNLTVTKSFASQFSTVNATKDTTYFADTLNVNVFSIHNLNLTVPSTQNWYYFNYETVHMAGGYNWNIDTNGTTIRSNTSSNMSVFGPFTDTMIVSSGSTIDFEISNISNSGRYQVTANIFHTVDTIFINSNITNIPEYNSQNHVSVYPNPTQNTVFIEGNNKAEFQLMDIKGRILRRGVFIDRIDLKELNKGIYFLMIEDSILKIVKE